MGREWLTARFSVADILMADVLRLVDRFDGLERLAGVRRVSRAGDRPSRLRQGARRSDGAFHGRRLSAAAGKESAEENFSLWLVS